MRKKLPAILSAALLAALILLTACSGGKPALPAWLDENEICAETYKALTEAMPKAVEPTDALCHNSLPVTLQALQHLAEEA